MQSNITLQRANWNKQMSVYFFLRQHIRLTFIRILESSIKNTTMRSRLLLSIVALLFADSANGIFLYGISSGPLPCQIKNYQIFLANLPWRKLEKGEMKDAEAYKVRSEQCQKFHDFSNNCTKPPSFCGGNDMKMYNFAGCIVLGDKLYKDGAYAGDLTADDSAELDSFNKDLAEFNRKQSLERLPKDTPFLRPLGIPPPGASRPPMPPDFCRQQ
uniref:Pepsin inhibitor-3-like repeated domain-containing protein n=1 Tax=Parascaris univalens TaxID=6257 RepID=A0A915CFI2_PARUN